MLRIFSENEYCADIVIGDAADENERYAAEELRKYLCKITGVAPQIVTETDNEGRSAVYVGETRFTTESFAKNAPDLKADGFVIRSSEKGLILSGKKNIYSGAGTIYAVYDFLESFLGVRFYAFDEEKVPLLNEIRIGDTALEKNPHFDVRQPLFASTRRHSDFTAKMRIKDDYAPAPGGGLRPLWAGELCHNYFSLVPKEKYEKQHPEWFNEKNYQLCYSQTGSIAVMVESLKKRICENPHSVFFAVSQNDTPDPCDCPECRKAYEKYGQTGAMIRYVNLAARQIDAFVQEKFPGRKVYLVVCAYLFSLHPPVVKTDTGYAPIDPSVVPEKNVWVFFTTISYCHYHRLNDASCEWNSGFCDDFFGWKSLVGERLLVWNYAANYAHYLYPFFNWNASAENYRFFYRNGVRYILEHGACECEFVELEDLRTYVTCKLLWDTDADAASLAEEFIDAYYKRAAGCVKAYLRKLGEHFACTDAEKGYHLRTYHLPESMFSAETFPKKFIDECLLLFAKALREAEKSGRNKITVKKRVMRVFMSLKYLIAINYDAYYASGKEQFFDDFVTDLRFCGIKKYKEHWPDEDTIDGLRKAGMEGKLLDY